MTRDELLARLQSIEWSDIEFKEASWAAPKDALETVSAFANTAGGYLVFGVKQANGTFDGKRTDQATDQAGVGADELDRSLDRLSEVRRKLIGFADVPRSMAELMAHAGFSHRPRFVTI